MKPTAQAERDFASAKFQWIERVARMRELPPLAARLCIEFLHHFNLEFGGKAWPSQETLAAALGVRREAVNKVIKALVEHKLIRITTTRGRKKTSEYWMILDPAKCAQESTLLDPKMCAENVRFSDGKCAPKRTRIFSKTPPTQEGKNIYRPPLGGDVGKRAAAKKEESRAVPCAAPNRTVDTTDAPAGFPDFWAAFPRKCSIGAARRAFARSVERGADPEVLTEGAKRYARERAAIVARDASQATYTLGPVRWLDEECWLEEVSHGGALVIDQAGNVVTLAHRTAKPRSYAEIAAARAAARGEAAYVQH